MSNIVKLHHNIKLDAGALAKLMWGGNALQTVTLTRRTPVNPQQAVGYKGVVDYTSSPVTSDATLDCILTEQSVVCGANTSVYKYAENEVIIGVESYVLTSCALNFQAGNPATVNYGYITAGLASALDTSSNPALLTEGEGAAFAVVMGEDGSGITLVALDKQGQPFIIPAGVQTLGFNASLNRNQILDVRKSSPVQFVTTYPLDITANLEILKPLIGAVDADLLGSIEVAGGFTTDDGLQGVTTPGSKGVTPARTGAYCKISGLMKTEDSESINVGGNLTYSYQFTGADLQIPLEESDSSTSGG